MKRRVSVFSLLLLLTVFAFILQGYHPGAEDDGVYLSAIKRDLNPSLYPVNAQFFTIQLQLTIFDKAVATMVKTTHLPMSVVCLGLQLLAIGLTLGGCWRVIGYCFPGFGARLAGVLTVSCLLTLSVAGTALYISDEHLHPRALATDAILFAIAATQRRRPLHATALLLVAFLFHPIMAAFGVSFCVLYAGVRRFDRVTYQAARAPLRAAAVPAGWLFSPATPAWREALRQHAYYTLARWEWYEWLGALAPPVLVWLLARMGRRRGNTRLYHLAVTVSLYSVVQLGVALVMLLPPKLERLTPLQPMRFLHLTYLMMALLAGATLGEYVLRARWWRWLLVFVPLAVVNGWAQRSRYPATPNLELPGHAPGNAWLQAFAWVQANTPTDAVFALDPGYLGLPGEDNHSFRALAERSSLVDDGKDAAVATQVPELAEAWVSQMDAQKGWSGWGHRDFVRLGQTTVARWVVVARAQAGGLPCPYANELVSVCRIPEQ